MHRLLIAVLLLALAGPLGACKRPQQPIADEPPMAPSQPPAAQGEPEAETETED